ncbi:hypothetical protein K504DRAFT_515369 [Pleomassaria siparia CBS 279.74]|uniref:Uncharacterized protein n=1 Tax=Pleomassaria siparia CBS 279.74 TaxID=1314801 RepID=A0A6G1JYT5_9PLEO|nr:hypothetical protein K504DRAFT_515369 [Pleomassaria siparia CBS 279.74]
MSTKLYTKDSLHEVPPELDPLENTLQRIPGNEQQTLVEAAEIWVGHIKHGRGFIDKQPKAANAELQLHAFDEYYMQSFSPTERTILRWMFCKKPMIFIGKLSAEIDARALEHQHFPHEVQFDSLEDHPGLSTGFMRPETLQDHLSLFHDDHSFDVGAADATLERHVVCVKHMVDKKRLIWPLIISVIITAASATVAGVVKHNFGSGMELGALIGAIFGIVWGFIMWLLG